MGHRANSISSNAKKNANDQSLRRIRFFVTDLIGKYEAMRWMNERREFWHNRNAVEMIQDDEMSSVMLLIHDTLWEDHSS